MTGTPTKDASEEQGTSFLSSFTRADMRLLVVTFAGTLVANVVTVLVVAVAIIAARTTTRCAPFNANLCVPPTSSTVLTHVMLALMGIVIVAVCVFGLKWRRRHYERTYVDQSATTVIVGVMVIAILTALVMVVTLLGYAAGIK